MDVTEGIIDGLLLDGRVVVEEGTTLAEELDGLVALEETLEELDTTGGKVELEAAAVEGDVDEPGTSEVIIDGMDTESVGLGEVVESASLDTSEDATLVGVIELVVVEETGSATRANSTQPLTVPSPNTT